MKSTRFLQFLQSQRPRLHYMQTFRVFKKNENGTQIRKKV